MTKIATNIKVNIDNDSSVPKYNQIEQSISNDIINGKIKKGQRIPSITDLSNSCSVSKETVEKAYKILRKRNLIFPVRGVGNFATVDVPKSKIDVFFMINVSSYYKMEVYNAFVDAIGSNAHVNIYIYYCDENLFINALKKNNHNYNYFVIMPHFKTDKGTYTSYTPKVIRAIKNINKDKIILVDNSYSEIPGTLATVYQDYYKDIIYALEKGLKKLKKYSKIILVYPTKFVFPHPMGIKSGFINFCKQYGFEFQVVEEVFGDMEFESKTVYLTIEEKDLIRLVQKIREKNLIMGKDIGVISYNETPLKALLGITVISTDFEKMGKAAAKLVLTNKKEILKNPFYYIERNSL